MSRTMNLSVPLNRVEGDLELRVAVTDGVVTDAWSSGIMFRGFEKLLKGRGALDGLVITPRICGICTTAHQIAAAKALDTLLDATPSPDAIRIRNLVLSAEHIQSDVRHAVLMFAADFTNSAYEKLTFYDEAMRLYAPLKGEMVKETVRQTKKVLEIVAILGGQWPHSSFIVPGGIASVPSRHDILQCRNILGIYRKWYEEKILGSSLERWQSVRSEDDLDIWLEDSPAHRNSLVGFFIRFARETGLDARGGGHGRFISYGSLEIPENSTVKGADGSPTLIPSGIFSATGKMEFDPSKVEEHVAASWYEDYEGGRHPFDGLTVPLTDLDNEQKYSWAKAPRYDGAPAETGPLAEAMVEGVPLFHDLLAANGPTPFARQLARLTRATRLIPVMEAWLSEITCDTPFYNPPPAIRDGEGFGLVHAARGVLGHWVKIKNNRIDHYQVITPTAWNGSPRDSEGVRGPWEEALVGTPIRDLDNPVELGHIVRSFDPCLVCTVHALDLKGSKRGRPYEVCA